MRPLSALLFALAAAGCTPHKPAELWIAPGRPLELADHPPSPF